MAGRRCLWWQHCKEESGNGFTIYDLRLKNLAGIWGLGDKNKDLEGDW